MRDDRDPPEWRAPAENPHRLDSRLGRLKAWVSMFVIDHGFFRYVYLNLFKIDAEAYRCAQPAPHHLRGRIARRGIKTVVSLRGKCVNGSIALEAETCRAVGIAFREITLRSREAPSAAQVHAAAALLEEIAYPVLFHCKSGADRAGLMSALYLMLRRGVPTGEAKRQLTAWRGHFRQSPTGVLDDFLEAVEAAEAAAAAEGRTFDLLAFVDSPDYDPKALTRAHRSKAWAVWLNDRLLSRE